LFSDDERLLDSADVLPALGKNENFNHTAPISPDRMMFQDLNLARAFHEIENPPQNKSFFDVFRSTPPKISPEIMNTLTNQWLLSHALALGDMFGTNNLLFTETRDTAELRLCPAHDFEISKHIVGKTTLEDAELTPSIGNEIYTFLNHGMAQNNIEYLKTYKQKTTNEFFEKLRAIDQNKLASIFDFTKIEHVFENHPKKQTIDFARLSETAFNGYHDRFKMLAEQWGNTR